jgi:hypothetical protein
LACDFLLSRPLPGDLYCHPLRDTTSLQQPTGCVSSLHGAANAGARRHSAEGRPLWLAAQKQLRAQATWLNTDGPLLEAYVQCVLTARNARRAGDTKLAGESERDAHRYATALLLTPESRKRHGVKAANGAQDELARLVA